MDALVEELVLGTNAAGARVERLGRLGREPRLYLGGVELDVTNEELASAANITPFTASRLLSKWRRSGVIAKRRGKILIPSVVRLAA